MPSVCTPQSRHADELSPIPASRPKGTTPLRKSGMHDTPIDRSTPHSRHRQIPAIRVRVTPTLPDRTRYVTVSVLTNCCTCRRTNTCTYRMGHNSRLGTGPEVGGLPWLIVTHPEPPITTPSSAAEEPGQDITQIDHQQLIPSNAGDGAERDRDQIEHRRSATQPTPTPGPRDGARAASVPADTAGWRQGHDDAPHGRRRYRARTPTARPLFRSPTTEDGGNQRPNPTVADWAPPSCTGSSPRY